MPKSRITPEGLNILNKSNASNDIHYWIGYYGLAFIPELDNDEIELPTGNTLVPEGSTGEMIYNIFQGSMVPEGYYTDLGGERAATKLANECMYTSSVTTRYRYVLDDHDNNQLVVFASRDDGGFYKYHTYAHGDEGGLPVPAPLYYGGEPGEYVTPIQDNEVVSHDTRDYSATHDDDTGMPSDRYAWAKSEGNTYDLPGSTEEFVFVDDDWQKQSISNFNRYHAPANTNGYAVNRDPACRNIAKATKLFPIESYDVMSTKKSDDTKVDTVQYTVNVNLGDVVRKLNDREIAYYETKTAVEKSEESYKVGFRFNRIGIYAVEVTLHSYDKDSAVQGACSDRIVQMQIHGNSEPILVGIIDLDEAMVVSEDTINECTFKFNVKFSDPDSPAITDTAVYEMLNEDDALTWYKNQLIANASTADAVTSIGVQMNYLRHQIDNMGSGTTSCNIITAGESNTTVIASSSVGNTIVDVGYLENVTTEHGSCTHTFDNDEYIELIDNIFSNGMSPVICYSPYSSYRPGAASITSGTIAHFARFCGVGRCTYMFHDAAHNVFIRLRMLGSTTSELYAVNDTEEPSYTE